MSTRTSLRARRFSLAGALLLGIAIAGAAGGQAPYRVTDIRTTGSDGIFLWRPWIQAEGIAVRGQVYFTANDGIHGNELWRTDATEAGTSMVVDLCPGSCSGQPGSFAVLGGALYFHADDGVHGVELWSSDGTQAGTVLVADIVPGLAGSTPDELVALGEHILFAAETENAGRELWRTDGTAAGTVQVLDVNPGPASSLPSLLVANTSRVFLTASDAAHGRELWASDGTAAGTQVLEVVTGPQSGNDSLYRLYRGYYGLAGQRLVFVVYSFTGFTLWGSDGTPSGTTQLMDSALSDSPFGIVPDELGRAFFQNATNQLWITDGTSAGTQMLVDVGDDSTRINTLEMVMSGGRLFFLVRTGDHGDWQIWSSDGSAAGTGVAIELDQPVVVGLWPLGTGLLFFYDDGIHGLEPWKSDGTTAGSSLLGDVASGSASSYDWAWQLELGLHNMVTLGGAVLMRLHDADGDLELWRLDALGAGQLGEIDSQSPSFEIGSLGYSHSRRPLAALGDTVLFNATDGAHGFELWRSEGSAANTSMVADLVTGSGHGFPTGLTALESKVLFAGRAGSDPGRGALWATDGTLTGTQELTLSDPEELERAGGLVYFTGNTPGASSVTLWKSDGTPAGTSPIPGSPPLDFGWTTRRALGSRLAFVGSPTGTLRELWMTDGTSTGTAAVSGSAPMDWPHHLAAAGSQLFFSGTDGAGQELWVTDGTLAHRVEDVHPGAASGIKDWHWDFEHFPPEKIASLGSRAVFLADDGTTGEEPWISDGTEQGTLLLADVMPGGASSDPDQLLSTGPRVYFVADDGVHGRELWSSDGSADGTRLVLDIVAGPGSSVPRHFTAIDGLLLFTAWDPLHGAEAWVSDGTPEGTYRISDIAAGAASSSPVHFTTAGDLLYFVANDNVTGFELWATGRSALRSTPTDFFTAPPCRAFDSRTSSPLDGSTRRIQIAGLCGIPTTARAVAANVTVVGGTASGRIRMAGTLAPQTGQVLVPFVAGRARAQQTMLRLGYGGLDASADLDSAPGGADVIVDVTGYFQ
jgi:ELWxxDGT repeat protein